MRACLLMIAAAGMSFTGPAAAEPAKAPVTKAAKPAEEPAKVVVAAAEQASTPTAAEPAAVPLKRERKARVTTCRCGDQAAGN